MSEPGRVYFDTCIFIELLQKSDLSRYDHCEHLQRRAQKRELEIVTSTVSIVEVNKLPEAEPLSENESRIILDFFENPYIAVRATTREVAELAHSIVRTHMLTNLDAIHIATALLAKVSVFYTYDGEKPKRKGLLKCNEKIGNPPLRIEVPPDPMAVGLFDEVHIEHIAKFSTPPEQAKEAKEDDGVQTPAPGIAGS